MNTFQIELKQFCNNNIGINAEMSLYNYFNMVKAKHDNKRFDKASDIEIGKKKISVKSARFTLISGSITKSDNFNEIVDYYVKHTHSNTFIYVSLNGKCYEMNINEFVEFVKAFCTLTKDSKGYSIIRAKHESKKMIEYLDSKI